MCDPLSIISGISAVATYVGGKQNAANQTAASNNAAVLQQQQINEKQQQINQQSALDQSERDKQGLLERAKMATISGESGALGISSDRLLSDSYMQEGTDMSSLEKNRLNSIKQTTWEAKQAQASATSRNTTIAANSPTLIGTGLQVGADIYKGTQAAKAAAKAKEG